MLIRKLFKYEMSHRVVGAYTKRCSQNIHGHSYKMEYLFEGNEPDNAQMVMDFGFVKKYFHPFVDAFDHAHMIWNQNFDFEINHDMLHIEEHNERYIIAPFSSTAEMQAKMFYVYGMEALAELIARGHIHPSVTVSSTIVHETDTGYAQYRDIDFKNCKFPKISLGSLKFSKGIQDEWSSDYTNFYNCLIGKGN